ncbi:hypothetical protein, partial [Micromonospora sp. NPDC005710]|uniref:hypothetical protein n=1 Tax=Micromonospora sp. NPDC005710 TaxID=3157051 RepID=UPI0033F1F837
MGTKTPENCQNRHHNSMIAGIRTPLLADLALSVPTQQAFHSCRRPKLQDQRDLARPPFVIMRLAERIAANTQANSMITARGTHRARNAPREERTARGTHRARNAPREEP